MRCGTPHGKAGGFSMIEVLVTILLISFSLLGLVGLLTRLQINEVDSYQRSQALLLLNDMVNRISSNRRNADAYIVNDLGAPGSDCPAASPTSPTSTVDLNQWCDALKGAAESMGGNMVGSMVGSRGCIEKINADSYMIAISWQGMAPLFPPPDSISCGAGAYDNGQACVDERCRRSIATIVKMSPL